MSLWLAPAKLNLFLHIVGRRVDGYHELQTVFQLIDWYDEIEFQSDPAGEIVRLPAIPEIDEAVDLAVQAAKRLQAAYGVSEGVRITLKKLIPVGSGLGGGSSDAATTLLALNQIWNLNLGINELSAIGRDLGADVTFFLHGTTAWGEGIGDCLTTVDLPPTWYVVAVPQVVVSTRIVYENAHFSRFRKPVPYETVDFAALHNDLEESACSLYPAVQHTLQQLRRFGPARMSGTGGAVFLPVESIAEGNKILAQLPDQMIKKICKSIPVSPSLMKANS